MQVSSTRTSAHEKLSKLSDGYSDLRICSSVNSAEPFDLPSKLALGNVMSVETGRELQNASPQILEVLGPKQVLPTRH